MSENVGRKTGPPGALPENVFLSHLIVELPCSPAKQTTCLLLNEAKAGTPAFIVPYANADEANHAPNENLEIERFIDGIKSGSALLAELGKLGRR